MGADRRTPRTDLGPSGLMIAAMWATRSCLLGEPDLPLLRATFEAHRASGDVLGLQPPLIALAACGDVDFGSLAGDDVLDLARRTGAVAVVSWIRARRARDRRIRDAS